MTSPDSGEEPRATVVAQQEDGSVLVVLDDGTRRRVDHGTGPGLVSVRPGQRVVLGGDGRLALPCAEVVVHRE